MSDAQLTQLREHLTVIHDHFEGLYNPADGEPFAMEIEFKITSENILAIKQARPWVFGGAAHDTASAATATATATTATATATARDATTDRTVAATTRDATTNNHRRGGGRQRMCDCCGYGSGEYAGKRPA